MIKKLLNKVNLFRIKIFFINKNKNLVFVTFQIILSNFKSLNNN